MVGGQAIFILNFDKHMFRWKIGVKSLSLKLKPLLSWKYDRNANEGENTPAESPDDFSCVYLCMEAVKGDSGLFLRRETACISAQWIILLQLVLAGRIWMKQTSICTDALTSPACPTIGELLCGMISCLVLPRDGWEEKPPSQLCHLNPMTERNEYISFAYVIFT